MFKNFSFAQIVIWKTKLSLTLILILPTSIDEINKIIEDEITRENLT